LGCLDFVDCCKSAPQSDHNNTLASREFAEDVARLSSGGAAAAVLASAMASMCAAELLSRDLPGCHHCIAELDSSGFA